MGSNKDKNQTESSDPGGSSPADRNDTVTAKRRLRKQSTFAGTIIEVREKNGVLFAAIPTVNLWLAWFFLFLNVFVPGLGTLLISFSALFGAKTNSKEPNRCFDFLLNVVAAILQLVTAVIIVGWILSISWGMRFVSQANERKIKSRAAVAENAEDL